MTHSATRRALIVITLLAGVALAAPLTLFTPDTPALASEVNANFASVKPPAGSIVVFAGLTAPPGWLFCDGATYDPAQHPELFVAIGNRFGGTPMSPRVPDLVGRVVLGLDPTSARVQGALADTLGETGGADVTTQVPAHTHGISSEPAHQHGLTSACNNNTCNNAFDGFTRGSGGLESSSFRTAGGGAHNHGGATATTGSATGVTNLPPFMALRYLIKT